MNIAFGKNTLMANITGSQNIAIGSNALFVNTMGSQAIAIGSNALYPIATFLFKIKLIPTIHNNISLPNYNVYIAIFDNKLHYFEECNNIWMKNSHFNLNKSLEIFNIMYPKWFTLYQFFKTQSILPLDIFIYTLQYYVDIKP